MSMQVAKIQNGGKMQYSRNIQTDWERKQELIDMNDDKTQEAKKGQEQDKSEISELDKAIRR